MSTTAEETFTVRVFRESPLFDQYTRWFMIPTHELMALHVDAFTCPESDSAALIAHLEEKYPNHVLVYI